MLVIKHEQTIDPDVLHGHVHNHKVIYSNNYSTIPTAPFEVAAANYQDICILDHLSKSQRKCYFTHTTTLLVFLIVLFHLEDLIIMPQC